MFNLWIVKNYLQHRLKAKNRHGLHSPFVYRLVDEVVYDFRAKKLYNEVERHRKALLISDKKTGISPKPSKVDQLIYRVTADWQPNIITQLGMTPAITDSYLKNAINKDNDNRKVVFINPNNPKQLLNDMPNLLAGADENTMLIFNGIYSNPGAKQIWTQIKANPKVTATVDLFWIGLVFFRKGQRREDFFIRY
jgi:hypothetical protein